MDELFNVGFPAINKHLKNIFDDRELMEEVVVSKMEIATRLDMISGRTQESEVNYYNLERLF